MVHMNYNSSHDEKSWFRKHSLDCEESMCHIWIHKHLVHEVPWEACIHMTGRSSSSNVPQASFPVYVLPEGTCHWQAEPIKQQNRNKSIFTMIRKNWKTIRNRKAIPPPKIEFYSWHCFPASVSCSKRLKWSYPKAKDTNPQGQKCLLKEKSCVKTCIQQGHPKQKSLSIEKGKSS